MSTGEQIQGQCEVTVAEGRAELERLLGDSRFHATERAKCILTYLAERRFQGCEEAVKAYSIALDVLGRNASFDASSDPIVRIEMSRLRSSLTQYYEAFGQECPVSIEVPIGRYLAVFSRRRPDAETDVADGVPDDEAATPELLDVPHALPPHGHGPRLFYTIGLAVLGIVVTASVGAAWYESRMTMTLRPAVMISISSAEDSYAKQAEATGDYLVTALPDSAHLIYPPRRQCQPARPRVRCGSRSQMHTTSR